MLVCAADYSCRRLVEGSRASAATYMQRDHIIITLSSMLCSTRAWYQLVRQRTCLVWHERSAALPRSRAQCLQAPLLLGQCERHMPPGAQRAAQCQAVNVGTTVRQDGLIIGHTSMQCAVAMSHAYELGCTPEPVNV